MLSGDVVVRNSAVITIDPGVTIYMGDGANLNVASGSVRATGTSSSKIRVLSDKTRRGEAAAPGDWNQWVLSAGASGSLLEHMVIENGSGLVVNGSAPLLNHLELNNHRGAAITLDISASPRGAGLSASGCTLNGILVPSGEISGKVIWGLRGIPYVLASGTVSVGASPTVASVTPKTVEQGQTLNVQINGNRLAGLTKATVDLGGLTLVPFPGGSDSSQSLQLSVSPTAMLGNAQLTLRVDAGDVVIPNALSVTAPLPDISTLAPNSIEAYRGETVLTLSGRNFVAQSEVLVNSAAIPTQYVSATQIRATLPEQTAASTLQVQVRNPSATAGDFNLSSQKPLAVTLPTPPKLTLEPTPLALPPDSRVREIVLRLSKPDYRDNTLSVSIADTTKATISPATVLVPAGQTTVRLSVTPRATGTTKITVSGANLSTIEVPLFVTADFAGINTSYAAPVGVLVGTGVQAPTPVQTTLTHANVGVAVGAVLTGVAPRGAVLGTAQVFTVFGYGIDSAAQVSVQPEAGVVVSEVAVAADGRSLRFILNSEPTAAVGPRRIVIKSGVGAPYVFADPAQAFVTLAGGLPVIDSIEPLHALQGSRIKLLIRGSNLHGGSASILPADGIAVDAQPTISADGTLMELFVQIAPGAQTGPRRIAVGNAIGTSSQELTVGNTFSIVSQIQQVYTPIISPQVGVQVGSATKPPVQLQVPILNHDVGVLVGVGIKSVTPASGVIGTTQAVQVTGQGLAAVTSVSIVPSTGMTVSDLSTNAEGSELGFNLSLAADATLGVRRLVFNTAAGVPVTPVNATTTVFLVAAPVAVIESTTPSVVTRGATHTINLRGRNFINVNAVRLEPAQGVTVNGPYAVNAEGTTLSFTVNVDAAAQSSPRTLIVNSAGGDSSATPAASNTLRIAAQTGATYAAITSTAVGVQVGDVAANAPRSFEGPVTAPIVGVKVGEPVSESRALLATSLPVTVSVGPVLESLSPKGLLQAANDTLLVTGRGLEAVTSAALSPATDVLLGAPSVNAEGTQISLPISIAAGAAPGPRRLRLATASGSVAALDANRALLAIGALPTISSFSPIVYAQGSTSTVVIRGSNLKNVSQVEFANANGVLADTDVQWSQDGLGELLTVRVYVRPDAALGDRVLQLRVPGGITSSEPNASNTARVVAPN